MSDAVLPYGRQTIEDDDIAAVAEALRGDFLTTGPTVEAFERTFAETVGARHAVACANGTAALHLAMLALDVMMGKAQYRSDLKPKKVDQAGFFGGAWPWVADRTVHGDALRVKTAHGESTANKGLGAHPRTTLTYDLAGKYRRFETLVGLDPGGPVRAKVTVRVLVDGTEKVIPNLQNVGLGKSVEVRIDVRKAKELTLVVEFGPAGGVGADVNWVDARLVE